MNKPPFNPKWSFRSQALKQESFIKKYLRQYDTFVNRQLDKLPPPLRYFKLPLRPVTILVVCIAIACNNILLSNSPLIQKKSHDICT